MKNLKWQVGNLLDKIARRYFDSSLCPFTNGKASVVFYAEPNSTWYIDFSEKYGMKLQGGDFNKPQPKNPQGTINRAS